MNAEDHSPFLGTYARFPLELVRGEGCRVQDVTGRWYLDACAGIAVMSLGYRHPAVMNAIRGQAERLLHASNLFHVDAQRRFAELLAESTSGGAVFLCNSGAEANEAAVKLVRKHHWLGGDPREEILVMENAFHGRTLMALAMTPRPAYQAPFGPLPGGVRVVSPDEAAAAVSARTAAVFIEPVQGEGGCRSLLHVLPALRAACDAHGALLVYDEIQCGLGRSGEWQHSPAPDLSTLAKALGGGLPLGALVASPALADTFTPGDHGSTFGGNPLACAAGHATLETILSEELPARCAALGATLRAGLEATGAKVTGEGLMLAAHLGRPSAPVIAAMRERGVIVCGAGPEAVRFLPPYVISEGELEELIRVFAGALEESA
ncbi:MAG: aminotransferase class III-fold pyridoxal phosphate-dependent enzyme [Alphaproteobacteria bacterium]|nr:aminotransferase class III-fold pyridoxal phosphate-dependent enzyme [Alphaproteobacteria bacterium]MCB9796904.1 aminotransferase class III-fold pyridoxal phosphate-dependent enzyme [Alphaproteobacteria bacterium]